MQLCAVQSLAKSPWGETALREAFSSETSTGLTMLVAKSTDVLDWPLRKRFSVTLAVCVGVSALFSLIAAVSSMLFGQIFDLLALTLVLVRSILFGTSFSTTTVEARDVVVAYVAAGFTAGICTAPLLPAIKRRTGAIFVGTIAALPYHFFIAFVLEESLSTWSLASTGTALVLSIIVGGIIGYTTWEDYDLENRKTEVNAGPNQRPRFKSWRA